MREIVEAAEIARAGDDCVSMLSVVLSKKEFAFLALKSHDCLSSSIFLSVCLLAVPSV